MYRLGLIEKRGFHYRSVELASEIKKMHQLQKEYLFLCNNDVESVENLVEILEQKQMQVQEIFNEQQDIYKETAIRKRSCKTPLEFRDFQKWHLEMQETLDVLKWDKKELKQQINIGRNCLKENLKAAMYVVDETEKLEHDAFDDIPIMDSLNKENMQNEFLKAEIDKREEVFDDNRLEEEHELTLEERAVQIKDVIVRNCESYDYLSSKDKAGLFEFKIDDIKYNLELHKMVLHKLGVQYSGAELFEDYQGVYDETVKNKGLREETKLCDLENKVNEGHDRNR